MSIAPSAMFKGASQSGGPSAGNVQSSNAVALSAASLAINRARAPITFGSSIAFSPADLTDAIGFITSSGPADPRLYIRPSSTLVEQLGFESNVFIILTPMQVRQHLAAEKQQQRKFLAVTGAATLGNEFGLDQDESSAAAAASSSSQAAGANRRSNNPLLGGGATGGVAGSISPVGALTTSAELSGALSGGGGGGVDDANAIGQPVTYGSKFCLMHKQSGMLVALLSTQPSAVDGNCFVISLVPSFETSSSAHFKFAPRYKIHSDGDTVYSGDQVVMQLFNRPVFMHLTRSSPPSASSSGGGNNSGLNTAANRLGGGGGGGMLGIPPLSNSRAPSALTADRDSNSHGTLSRTSSFAAPLSFRQDEVNGSEHSTSWIVVRYDVAADEGAYAKSTVRAGKMGLLTGTPLAFFHREMEMVVTTTDTSMMMMSGAGDELHGISKEDPAVSSSTLMGMGREAFGAGDTLKPPQRPFGGSSNGSRSVSRMADSNASIMPTGTPTGERSPSMSMLLNGGGGGGGAMMMGGTAVVLGEAGLSSEDFNFLTLQCRCTALWILEAADPTNGGPVRTRLRYRIRQAATNKYLSAFLPTTIPEYGSDQVVAQPVLQLVSQPRTEEGLARTLFAVSLAVDNDANGGFVTQSDFLRIQHCETGAWLGTATLNSPTAAATDADGGNSGKNSDPHTGSSGSGGKSGGGGGVPHVTLLPRWQPHDALLAGHVIGHLQRSVLHLYRFAETLERCRDYFAKTRSPDLRGPHVQHVLRGATDALVALISFCSDSENDNALEREGLPIRHHQQMLFDLHLHKLLIEVTLAPFIGRVDHMPDIEVLRGGAFDIKMLKTNDAEPLFDLIRLCIRLLKQMIKSAPELAARIADYIPIMYVFDGYKLHVADTVIEFFGNNLLLPYDLKTASIDHYIEILTATSRRSGGYLRILSALATDSLYRSLVCEQLAVRHPNVLTRLEMVNGELCLEVTSDNISGGGAVSAGQSATAGSGSAAVVQSNSAKNTELINLTKFLLEGANAKHVKLFEAQIELFSQLTQGSTEFVVEHIRPFLPQEQCEWILQNILWSYDDSALSLNRLDFTRAHIIDIAMNLHVLPVLRTPFIQLRAGVPLMAGSKLRHSNLTHSGVDDTRLIKTLKNVCKRILKENPFQVMENRRRNILLKSCVNAWKRLIEHWQYSEDELDEVLPMLINVLDGSRDTKTLKRALMGEDGLASNGQGSPSSPATDVPIASKESGNSNSAEAAAASATAATTSSTNDAKSGSHDRNWSRHRLTEDGILAFQVKEAAIETLHLLLDNMAHVQSNVIIARSAVNANVPTNPQTMLEDRIALVEEANGEIIEKFDTKRLLKLLTDITRYEMQSLSRKALDLIAHLGFVRQRVFDRITSLPITRDRQITMYFDECFSAADSLVSQVNQLAANIASSVAVGSGGAASASASPFGGGSGPNTAERGNVSAPSEYYAVRRRAISEGPDFSPATPRGRSLAAAAGGGQHNNASSTTTAGGYTRPRTISEIYGGSPSSMSPLSNDNNNNAGSDRSLLLKATVMRVIDLMDRGCGADHSQSLASTIISHWGIHLTLLRLLTHMSIEDPIYPLIIRFFQRFTQVDENARKLVRYTDVFLAGVQHHTAHNDCLRIIVAIMTSNVGATSSRAEMDSGLVGKIEQMIAAERESDNPDGSLLEMINKSCASEALPFKFLRDLVEGLHQRNVFSMVREAHSRWSMARLQFVADLLMLLNHYACHSAQARNAVNKIITPATIIKVLLQRQSRSGGSNNGSVSGGKGGGGGGGGDSGVVSNASITELVLANTGMGSSSKSRNNDFSGDFSSNSPPRPLPLTVQGPLFRLLTSLWSFEDESSYEMQRIRTQWTNSSDWWTLLTSVKDTISRVAHGNVNITSTGDGQIGVEKFLTSYVIPSVTMFYRNCMQVALVGRKQELGFVTRELCAALRDVIANRVSAFSTTSMFDVCGVLIDICEQLDLKAVWMYLDASRQLILQERRAVERARQMLELNGAGLGAGAAAHHHHRPLSDDDDGNPSAAASHQHRHLGLDNSAASFATSAASSFAKPSLPENLEKCCVTQEPILSFVRMLQHSQLNPTIAGDDFMIKTMTLLKRGDLSTITSVSLVKIFRQALTDCSGDEKMVATLQDNMDALGLMRVATALSESKDDTVLEAAYRLGIALLEGGNTRVQNRMLEYFETHDEKFFANARATLDRCKQAVIELRKKGAGGGGSGAGAGQGGLGSGGGGTSSVGGGGGSGGGNGTTAPLGGFSLRKAAQIDSILKLTRLSFRFLQLLCEGHHLGMQNYMRNQQDNLHSINMITEVCLLMKEMCAATVTGVTIGSGKKRKGRRNGIAGEDSHDADRDARFKTQCLIRLLPVLNAGFALFTEVCQGPCPANQTALLSHGISLMITHGFEVQPSDEALFNTYGTAAAGNDDGDDEDEGKSDDGKGNDDGDEKSDDDDDDDDDENLAPAQSLVQLRARASTTLLAILEGCTDARTYTITASQVPLETIRHLLEMMLSERSQEEIVNQLENDDVTETVFNLLIYLIQLRDTRIGNIEYTHAITALLEEYQHLSKYLGSVEVQRESRLENVFFRVPRLCMALSDHTKDILLWSVDRSNRSTKLADFVLQADEIIFGMEVAHTFENKVIAHTRFSIKSASSSSHHHEKGPIVTIHKLLKTLPRGQGERIMLVWNSIVPYIFTYKLEYYERLFLAMAIAVNVSLLVFGKKLDPQEVDAVSDLDSPSVFDDSSASVPTASGGGPFSAHSPLQSNSIAIDTNDGNNNTSAENGDSQFTENATILSTDSAAFPETGIDNDVPTAAQSSGGEAEADAFSTARNKTSPSESDEGAQAAADGSDEQVYMSPILAGENPFTFSEGRTMGIPTWLFSVAGVLQLFFTAAVLLIDTMVLLPTDIYRIQKRRERRNAAGKGSATSTTAVATTTATATSSTPSTSENSSNASSKLLPAASPMLKAQHWLTAVTASNTWAVCTRIQTIYRVMMVLFSLLSFTVSPLFCAAFLIALIHQSSVLMNVIVAITQNGRSLLLTMGLGVVMVYLFAIVGFTTFPSSFGEREEGGEPNCDSFGRCFAFILVHGLRQGGGVGDIMKDMPWSSKGLVPRMGYDFLFFALLNVVFLNILFGIIIDAFAELRDDKRTKEEDMHGTCYICGTQAEEFEKHGVSFLWHVRKEHNMWQYLYLMYHLRTKDPNEYTGQESYVQKLIDKGSLAFFPEETSLTLQARLAHVQQSAAGGGGDGSGGADEDNNANGSSGGDGSANNNKDDHAEGGSGGGSGEDKGDKALIAQLYALVQESINSGVGLGSGTVNPLGGGGGCHQGGGSDDEQQSTRNARFGGGNNAMNSHSGGGGGGGGGVSGQTIATLTGELAAAHRLTEKLQQDLALSQHHVSKLEKHNRKHEATITALTEFFQKDIPVVWHDALREIIEAREGKKALSNVPEIEYIENIRRELEEKRQQRREERAARGEHSHSVYANADGDTTPRRSRRDHSSSKHHGYTSDRDRDREQRRKEKKDKSRRDDDEEEEKNAKSSRHATPSRSSRKHTSGEDDRERKHAAPIEYVAADGSTAVMGDVPMIAVTRTDGENNRSHQQKQREKERAAAAVKSNPKATPVPIPPLTTTDAAVPTTPSPAVARLPPSQPLTASALSSRNNNLLSSHLSTRRRHHHANNNNDDNHSESSSSHRSHRSMMDDDMEELSRSMRMRADDLSSNGNKNRHHHHHADQQRERAASGGGRRGRSSSREARESSRR